MPMTGLILGLLLQATDYTSDFDLLLESMKNNGVYVHKDNINLEQIKNEYRSKFKDVRDPKKLLNLFETVVGEMHDFHSYMSLNNQKSPRLVPSGCDLFGRLEGQVALIDQVQPGSEASKKGVLSGDEVVEINGVKVWSEIGSWLSSNPGAKSHRAKEWALNSALAGRWDTKRTLKVKRGKQILDFQLDSYQQPATSGRLTVETKPNGVLYLRVENSLGNHDLIRDFDQLVPQMRRAKGIILDLRNTPGGGNTTVARGIMGLFINKKLPYQRHVIPERATKTIRDWTEMTTPRLPRAIEAPLVVLVSRWTASMGEGLAVGLDGMKRAKVVGTRMAGLRGGIAPVTLPTSGFKVFFPTEDIYHVNGIARHDWVPPYLVKPGKGDPWIDKAMNLLKR